MDTNKKACVEALDELIATATTFKTIVLNTCPDSLVREINEAAKKAKGNLEETIPA